MRHRLTVATLFSAVFVLIALFSTNAAPSPQPETLNIEGLSAPVEILIDPWGIAHIYAQNEADLFFAQGFNAARDRLFQLELWRRAAQGLMAELQGEKALARDRGARLLRFRGDMDQEMAHYHPRGKSILSSFVAGYNSYVELTRAQPGLLPLEFHLLGIKPGQWTPEVVVSRHNGLFRNAGDELVFARLLSIMESDALKEVLYLTPGKPNLRPAQGLDLSLFSEEVLRLYRASRAPFEFDPQDIVDPQHRGNEKSASLPRRFPFVLPSLDVGSNNWVVSGRRTFTGHPFMANDPHRVQQTPSLRYWVHLVAPGWNVIGAGEPALPGVSIGHNEYGAWGLTIFSVDQEDIYVYDTNPADPTQYRYAGSWENMRSLTETIPVKAKGTVHLDLKFTRHGPILFEDEKHDKAYALRAAWLEVGTAPYLASLRLDQARSWSDFQTALAYSRTPSENFVWADKKGNIGWQAAGIAPIRRNWDGLLPVPGDGRFEWQGYLPPEELPHVLNPPDEFFATANQNNLPPDFPHSVGFLWTDPFRFARVQEVLATGRRFTLADMMRLQHDELSIPARSLVPLLAGLESPQPRVQKALESLLSWDFVLRAESTAAAVYMIWERKLSDQVWNLYLPEKAREILTRRPVKKLIEWVTVPDHHFGENPTSGRDQLLLSSLEEAVQDLEKRFGADMEDWRYGDARLHHIVVEHPLSEAVNDELRKRLDVGPASRGGNSYTVNMTNSADRQTSGASFRIIVDLGDWDQTVGTNNPGQSGNPDSPHYDDLFELWSKGQYFPVYYSREKIEAVAEKQLMLRPL